MQTSAVRAIPAARGGHPGGHEGGTYSSTPDRSNAAAAFNGTTSSGTWESEGLFDFDFDLFCFLVEFLVFFFFSRNVFRSSLASTSRDVHPSLQSFLPSPPLHTCAKDEGRSRVYLGGSPHRDTPKR